LDSRERVYRTIEFGGPDRLPIRHVVLPGAYAVFGDALTSLIARYPSDFAVTGYAEPSEYGAEIGVPQADGWGAKWVRTLDDNKGLIVEHPLYDWSKLDSYQFPDPLAIGDWSDVPDRLRANDRRKYVMVDGDTLFQRMFYLRGYENLMLDLADRPSEVAYLRDRIVDFIIRKLGKWLEYDVDGFEFRDDWGTQQSLMIRPEDWREFFKPAYARIFDAVTSAGKHIWFHSDGQIVSILGDLVELGARVVNPQAHLIGIERLSADFGGRVCFLGDVDRQQVLPFGTPDEVRAHVREAIHAFGRFDGGFIARGEVAVDTPMANVDAMYETFAEWRPG
jgi:uroporphyrinogen decarboxylase